MNDKFEPRTFTYKEYLQHISPEDQDMVKKLLEEANKKVETITLPESHNKHIVGNESCTLGWCGGPHGYPKPCLRNECDGLVHAEFGDENYDGDYWLYTECDVCGEREW